MIGLLLLACLSRGDGPPAGGEGAGGVALPADLRACATDADCAVAPALAGLDHLPRPGDACRAVCYVGVRREHRAAWARAVEALAGTVPCEVAFEPCPPPERYRATCVEGACRARTVDEGG